MLEKKGVSPVQCQTATSGGNGVGSGGGGGSASGTATANTPQSQQSITGADVSNGLESNVLPQNRNSGSAATNSASMNNTNSAPNTPNDKMGALTAQQDFVIIKSEDQKGVSTNHCIDAKSKLSSDSNAIQSQMRNVNTNDSKLNTTNTNLCGTRVAISNNNINNNNNNSSNNNNCNNNNNNNIKCRDSVTMSCASNGPLNGPLNGMCANNTSPMDILNDGKLSSLTDELGMPVASGNVTMSSGDLPPLSLMSQTMNMPGPRSHCGQPPPQGPHLGINVSSNHVLHPHSHNNMHHLVSNSNIGPQKASMTMDSQYMQQQSQIFVFNTKMANQAAETVDSGQFASIIEFHCSIPETKMLLEKYPMKQQFNRSNSAAWLNNLAQIKQGGRGIKPNLANNTGMHPPMLNNPFGPRARLPPASCVGPCNPHNPSGMPSGPGPGGGGGAPNNWSNNSNMCSNPNWSAQQQQQSQPMFAQNSDMNPSHKFPNSPMGTGPRACGPNFGANNNFQNNPQMFNNAPPPPLCNPGQGMPPQLAGPEIPDENLTPQQRQHREKQLAILRKMQQQLCPEMMESSPMPMNQGMRMPAPNQGMDYMMDPSMCANNMCPVPEHEHLHNSDPSMNNLMTPSSMIANSNNNNTNTTQYSQSHSTMPPTSASAQPEWSKVQNNFMDERRRKSQAAAAAGGQAVHNNSVPISHHSPLSQPSSTMNSPSPCISQSPGSRIPPPPYNQGIRPHSSPHPSSPATGSLPMPSPRMQSPADASRQQFTPAGQSRLPHTSPGPATPSADSNSSISGTGVHSPKPLPSSTSQNSLPSATSSSVVQNSCNVSRTQTSTNVTNLTNISVTTPSNVAPSSSPSNVKKLPNNVNLMSQTPKPLNPDCGELLINPSSNSGLDSSRKIHSGDMPLLGPTNDSSPFVCNKQEPALMPVPSPQQIQYINAFEGQELTIQKQPNTSLRDADLISPAPDLDLGFQNEFGNNCQPFHGNERLPNFMMMDSMNTRFPTNPQTGNMSGGPQFDMNPRFMNPDNNSQRFVGPNFDGPSPRMPNSHDNQFRPQNMLCMPYGQMENNMMRFPNSCDNLMPPRIRGPTDMGMNTRFPQHMNDNMQSPSHFNSSTMSPMSNDQMNMMPYSGSNQASGPGCLGPVNNFNPQMESGISSTHLQNLQKMTPPFDIGPPNKVDGMMMPNGSMQHNHSANNQVMHGPNGPMAQVSQSQRSANFDPISSMAAMGEPNSVNQMNPQPNMMSGPSMNMSSMQVASNGPPPANMVNFHTSMSSMQGIHQNMSPDGNGLNGGGMQNQYNMPQMSHNMTGGPQTVNNTYVNATMSIQQLNIQNVPTPNFNPNMDQSMNNQNNMNIPPPSMAGSGSGLSPPSGAMQMMQQNSSAKLGSGFGHRMPGPGAGPNFTGPQMNNPRVMSPMNYPTNPHMMQRCAYNSANIQVKPDAPNTIQYHPTRPQNPNSAQRAPSLDFLQRFEPPLTNLGNKLPTHNLQYFPSNNGNINNSQGMPLQPRMVPQNMPIASGPGRPLGSPMVRGPNPNAGIVGGQQPMMPSADMFGRPPGPNNIMNGPHMGSTPPNAMFPNMKQPGSGPMSPVGLAPDVAQPLPPTVGPSYNYKQTQFMAPMSSDPNYAIQFHNFQQQLYATNTRTSNNTANTNSGSNNPRMSSNNFYSSSK